MFAACATNTEANDRYNVLPSKLNVYPVGSTKETIFRGTPSFSMFSIALGSADSELVVAKAMDTGSEIARKNFRIGTPTNRATGNNTPNRNTSKAPYRVNNSFSSEVRISIPKVAYRYGDCCTDAKWRKVHDDIGKLKHGFRETLRKIQNWFFLLFG